MDETEKGSEAPPEEKTAEQPAVEVKPPEPPAAPPAPRKQYNWTHIGLIVLSVAVVLLLASTITLAVTGNFGHGGKGGQGRCYQGQNGPMMRGYGRGFRGQGTPPWMNQNPENQQRRNQQDQAPQSTPSAPQQQQAPQQQAPAPTQ